MIPWLVGQGFQTLHFHIKDYKNAKCCLLVMVRDVKRNNYILKVWYCNREWLNGIKVVKHQGLRMLHCEKDFQNLCQCLKSGFWHRWHFKVTNVSVISMLKVGSENKSPSHVFIISICFSFPVFVRFPSWRCLVSQVSIYCLLALMYLIFTGLVTF